MCFITSPLTLNVTHLKVISGIKTPLLKTLKIYRGMAFWIVRRIRRPSHLISALSLMSHWWNGNPPVFRRILNLAIINITQLIVWDMISIHLSNSMPPTLWTKKNFNPLTPRNRPDLNTSKGKKRSKFSSIIIHTRIILEVLMPHLIINTNKPEIVNRRNKGICSYYAGLTSANKNIWNHIPSHTPW